MAEGVVIKGGADAEAEVVVGVAPTAARPVPSATGGKHGSPPWCLEGLMVKPGAMLLPTFCSPGCGEVGADCAAQRRGNAQMAGAGRRAPESGRERRWGVSVQCGRSCRQSRGLRYPSS